MIIFRCFNCHLMYAFTQKELNDILMKRADKGDDEPINCSFCNAHAPLEELENVNSTS